MSEDRMEMCGAYVLDGHLPIKATDLPTWEEFMVTFDRVLFYSELHAPSRVVVVQTWFLGWGLRGPGEAGPFFFGLLVTTNGVEGSWRYSETWEKAAATHGRVLDGFKRLRRD